MVRPLGEDKCVDVSRTDQEILVVLLVLPWSVFYSGMDYEMVHPLQEKPIPQGDRTLGESFICGEPVPTST